MPKFSVIPFSKIFSSSIRDRGQAYFAFGHVMCEDHEDDFYHAIVQGSRNSEYFVSLDIEEKGDLFVVGCGCPHFEDQGAFCKHIWATMLQAEDEQWLPAFSNNKVQFLRKDEYLEQVDEDYEEDDYDDGFGDDSEPLTRYPDTIRQFSSRRNSEWKRTLSNVQTAMNRLQNYSLEKDRKYFFMVDANRSKYSSGAFVHLKMAELKKNGEWGVIKDSKMSQNELIKLREHEDYDLLETLLGSGNLARQGYYGDYDSVSSFVLPIFSQQKLMKMICATGRALIATDNYNREYTSLTWEEEPWEFKLQLKELTNEYEITGYFQKNKEKLSISDPILLIGGGLLFTEQKVSPLIDHNSFPWIAALRDEESIFIPKEESANFMKALYSIPGDIQIKMPKKLKFEEIRLEPKKQLTIKTKNTGLRNQQQVRAYVEFDYNDVIIQSGSSGEHIFDDVNQKMIYRDLGFESKAVTEVLDENMKKVYSIYHSSEDGDSYEMHSKHLSKCILNLLSKNWRIFTEGKSLKRAGDFELNVTSGIDWFELHGSLKFEEQEMSLPDLLKAAQNSEGESLIELGDGSFGMLPEDWLKKYSALLEMGDKKEGHIEFKKNQVGLLDTLLQSEPDIKFDKIFSQFREKLLTFQGIKPLNEPSSFKGELRAYQKEGLAWLNFLQEFNLGGCLADDMGLGKTVQMLALLEKRRGRSKQVKQTSLIIVPRSLIHNWYEEAKKFTPNLKVLIYSGIERKEYHEKLEEYHIVLTTYGTMRRDIGLLVNIEFDYIVLDEAQAIKNSKSQSAKASRLLKGKHRLALSGTPVENHIGELWSIFEFLNPGMLGHINAFSSVKEEESREVIRRSIRPFMLRRTKDQVAKDLPAKTEQVIYCEMSKKQKSTYDKIKKYYQANLTNKIKEKGMNRVKIQVLEALLRLRQAACHPGLIDESYLGEESCKLDTILEQLKEVVDEGHKVLVFSQFTSFLKIVKQELVKENIAFHYLDGRTRKRQELVESFQNSPDIKVFLISLKAGGVGLNLTSADYVFILDPWWNPAVEAQAIDRAHRIGQTKKVFAYRLICKDTVEEKVMELQKNKKELVKSIISEDKNLIKNLTQEDLGYLLS